MKGDRECVLKNNAMQPWIGDSPCRTTFVPQSGPPQWQIFSFDRIYGNLVSFLEPNKNTSRKTMANTNGTPDAITSALLCLCCMHPHHKREQCKFIRDIDAPATCSNWSSRQNDRGRLSHFGQSIFFLFSIPFSEETRKIIKRNLKRCYFLMFIHQDSKTEPFLHECKSFWSKMWSNSPYLNHKNSSSPLSLSHHHKNKFRLPFCKKKADK